MNWRVPHSIRLIDAIKEQVGSTLSMRAIKRLLDTNVCKVNGRIERFGSTLLQKGAQIELASLQRIEKPPSFSVVYEDEDLFVIDKPPGFICQDADCQKKCKRSIWLAHRLDKDTTGLLLFGKSERVATELQELFERKEVRKEYLALADGRIKGADGVIKNRLAKKGFYQGQTLWGAAQRGLSAETHWERLDAGSHATLLLCKPQTGRTHQIRVHLAEMGHPILIDRQYASHFRSNLLASRPLLHAWKLHLPWKGRSMTWTASLPVDFLSALKHCQMGGIWPNS